ncbi:MAG: glycoside hydrolase family 99-like domain-containing protein, partial [Bacteroidota bacterium]
MGVYKMHKLSIRNLFSIFLICFSLLQFSCSTTENSKIEYNEYSVAAYVWPSCHHDERFGDILWPEGIGEWEVIKKGNPRFDGHYQPRLPLWGYKMDNDPKVVEKWIDAAVDHGVN